MTTDSDSRVDPDWIAANLIEIGSGADAVAGMLTGRSAPGQPDHSVRPVVARDQSDIRDLRFFDWERAAAGKVERCTIRMGYAASAHAG